MIAAFDGLPRTLAALCGSMVVQNADNAAQPICRETIACAMARFRTQFRQPEAQPLASLWSIYYFNALIIPSATALLCRDRVLPVGLARCDLATDGNGIPKRILLDRDESLPPQSGHRFDTLIHGHLEPFIAMFAQQTRLGSRVLWSNAAVTLDYVVETVAGLALPEPRREAEALLAGTDRTLACRTDPCRKLAAPWRETPKLTRERKVCCTRYRLPGVAPCPGVCPSREASMRRHAGASCREGVGDA